MRNLIRRAIAAAAALVLAVPLTTSAQQGAVEFGVDAGIEYDIVDDEGTIETDDVFSAQLPGQRFRVGFFVSDRVVVEPGIALTFIDVGDNSFTDLTLDAALGYHFSADPDRTRFFVHGGGAFNVIDLDGDESDTQFGVFGGLGAKVPVADQLALRFEGNGLRAFESDDRFGFWGLQGVIGISFFTR